MALVFMGSHGWGTLFIDPADIEAGVGLQSSFTNPADGTAVTHYADDAGASPSTGPVTADANGRLARWVEEGTYDQTLPGGAVLEVQAVSGATLAAVESRVPDLTGAVDQDALIYSGALNAVQVVRPAAAKASSFGFRASNSAAANDAALTAALTAILPATDPATTTRVPNYALEVSAGRFKLSSPFALRSVMGFELKTAGPKSTIFSAEANMEAVLDLNGVAHSQFGGFSVETKTQGTDLSIVAQKGVKLYWDSTLASRSTLQNHFDYIDVANCHCVMGMQIGRDGDNNQCDSTDIDYFHALARWGYGYATVTSGSATLTGVTGGTFIAGQEIYGTGIPAATFIGVVNTGAGTLTLVDGVGAPVNATANGSLIPLWVVEAGMFQAGLKVGSGVHSNNLVHHMGYAGIIGFRRNIHMAASQISIDCAQLQAAESDVYFESHGNYFKLGSGRSENSQRLISHSGATTLPAQAAIEDFDFYTIRLAGDGRWITFHSPGTLTLNRIRMAGGAPPFTPKIRSTPSGVTAQMLTITADGLILPQAPETAFDITATRVQLDVRGYAQSDGASGAIVKTFPRWRTGLLYSGAYNAAPVAERAEYKRRLQLVTGTLDETYERDRGTGGVGSLTGVLTLMGLVLLVEGEPITNLLTRTSTTLVTSPTNQWMALVRATAGGAVLAKTEDKLTEAWAANLDKSFAITGGPYIPAATELAWLCLMVKGGGGSPTFWASASGNAALMGKTPIKAGTADTGLTDPASLGGTIGTITATANLLWGAIN